MAIIRLYLCNAAMFAVTFLTACLPTIAVGDPVPNYISYLNNVMDAYHESVIVYEDVSAPGNHFHARGQLPNQNSLVTIDESDVTNPRTGATAIRASLTAGSPSLFGGFYFLNGILLNGAPVPYFGGATIPGTSTPITANTGIDLSGADSISFWTRGAAGGEKVEFFVAGVGWSASTNQVIEPFPDTAPRTPGIGQTTTLSTAWTQHTISLAGINLTNIMGGFGWVASDTMNPSGVEFYLDDILFNLSPSTQNARLAEPRFLRSFTTLDLQPDPDDDNEDDDIDLVLRNLAFTYDNALVLLAYLAHGSEDGLRRAKLIGDAFVYASENDRFFSDGRMRTAYAAGDIALPPG